MQGLRPFCTIMKRYAGINFKKSQFHHLTAKVGLVARRNSRTEPWDPPTNLGPVVNSPAGDYSPRITADGLELYFISNRSGGLGNADIYMTTRATKQDAWGPASNVGPVNSGDLDQWVCPSGDGLTLLFQAQRAGGQYGGLYMSKRETRTSPWSAPVYLGLPAEGSVYTLLSGISADGSMLYLSDHINYAPRPGGAGGADMWQVPVIPIFEFNGDEIVDFKDFSRLAQYWFQDELSVDIAPPFGDSIVDFQDLAVFAEYWLFDFSLVAHWKLDETSGDIAYDSRDTKNGTLHGNPVWQPTGGMINGALQLDGAGDYVATPFVLNPSSGPFTTFAWVKAGSAGQVVISQAASILLPGGKDWLCADPLQGRLMTALTDGSLLTSPLVSEFVITDGDWHHIGVMWDGSRRHLYADGAEIAKDTGTIANLVSCDRGLYLGAGRNLTAGTFCFGLIDDVRIYDRAITP